MSCWGGPGSVSGGEIMLCFEQDFGFGGRGIVFVADTCHLPLIVVLEFTSTCAYLSLSQGC